MKTKTYTTLALALAVSGCAWATEVVSSNVVGYQKLTIPAGGYALLANPFTVVGSDGDTFAINDMFANDADVSKAGNNSSLGDTIEVWNPAIQNYDAPWFFSARVTGGAAWASSSTPRVATDAALEAGDGFWYFNRNAAPITLQVCGEVATNDVVVTLSPGYTLVCNPFPADISLNNGGIDWAGSGSKSGNNSSLGDTIEVWNPSIQNYDAPWFFSARVTGGAAWAASATPRVATDASIPAGAGFWYYNRNNTDVVITLKSPLAAAE